MVLTAEGLPQLGGAVGADRCGQADRVVRTGTLETFQDVVLAYIEVWLGD
jgi:hypothetical protein